MVRIKSIKRKRINDERLYNLAVEDDESYIANGIVVHNCRSRILFVSTTDIREDKLIPNKPPEMTELAVKDNGSNFIGQSLKEAGRYPDKK